jgi:hypothetical protein
VRVWVCGCHVGFGRTRADDQRRPHASGSPQIAPKFGPALGRAGQHSSPFLIWVCALGRVFTQTDKSGVRFSVWVSGLEMP